MTRFAALLALLALTACAVGPDYVKPAVDVPANYKQQGMWKPAEPEKEAVARGPWWEIFKDPILNDLQNQVTVSNQNLKVAEAAYRQARAFSDLARSNFFPNIGADAGATRQKTAGGASNRFSASVSAAWEPDIWGRIRRDVESADASADASAADLANARLSAQSELAVNYFALRAQDEIKALLDKTVKGYEESLKITRNQYDAGVVAKTDVMQAETQLKSAQSQAVGVALTRAQLENAIAVLIGKPPSEFALQPSPFLTAVPAIPAGVPSTLLERRPDISAAERSVASANAQIGVAVGAYFPDLILSASYGFASAAIGSLLQASNNIWSLGPALALTLFDGGAREAQLAANRAAYDQNVAAYRQTVLTAFQEVEDQLAAQRILAQQSEAAVATMQAAQEAAKLVRNQYRSGIVPFTSVVVAEASSFSAQQSVLDIRRQRLAAAVNLIKALGGGWTEAQREIDAAAAMAAKEAPSVATPVTNTPAPATPPKKESDSFLGMGSFF